MKAVRRLGDMKVGEQGSSLLWRVFESSSWSSDIRETRIRYSYDDDDSKKRLDSNSETEIYTHSMFEINSMKLQKSNATYGDVLCFSSLQRYLFHTNNQEILIVV
jgi:hypothetical protein